MTSFLIPNQESDIPPSPFRDSGQKAGKSGKVSKGKMIFFYVGGSLLVAGLLLVFANFRGEILPKPNQPDSQKIIKDVASKIHIPDETPTIIAVVDLEKIKKYQFFSKADIGDQVLIFPKSQKAILYRPREKKIIEVGKVMDEGQVAGDKTNNESKQSTSSTPIPSSVPTPIDASSSSQAN